MRSYQQYLYIYIYKNTYNNKLHRPSCQKQGIANSCSMAGVEEDIIMSATFHQQIKQNTLGCPDEGRLLFSNLMLMSCQPLRVISGRLNSAIRKYTFQNPLHNYMYTHCNQVKKKMIPAVNTHTDTASMTACTGVEKQLLMQHLHTRQWLNLRVSIQKC